VPSIGYLNEAWDHKMRPYRDKMNCLWLYAISACLTLIIAVVFSGASLAAEISSPKGPVILTVEGAIENRNTDAGAIFDFEMLESLPRHAVTTTTPWTQGKQTFEGVRMADILAHVGATGNLLTAYALNDYFIDIPVGDIATFDVLLADTHNGDRMSVRDKGPLWIIYPMCTILRLK